MLLDRHSRRRYRRCVISFEREETRLSLVLQNIKKYYDSTNQDTHHQDKDKNTREMDKTRMELDSRTRTEPEINIAEGNNSLQLGQHGDQSHHPEQSQSQTPTVLIGPKRAPVVESMSQKEAFEEFDRIWQIIDVDFVEYVA